MLHLEKRLIVAPLITTDWPGENRNHWRSPTFMAYSLDGIPRIRMSWLHIQAGFGFQREILHDDLNCSCIFYSLMWNIEFVQLDR